MRQKGFALLPVIIIVILIGALGYFIYQNIQLRSGVINPTPTTITSATNLPKPSPTFNPTASWKTYLDTKNGVEFKYPQNWDAEKLPGWTLNVFLDDHKFEIPLFTEFITPIEVSFNEIQNTNTNVKSYSEKTIEEATIRLKTDLYGQDVTERDNLTIGGHKAIQLEGTAGPGMLEGVYSKYTLIQMDNRVLMVSLHNSKNFNAIYNQILSTFKFTQ